MQNFSTKIQIDYNRPIFLAAAATSTRLTHLQSLLRKLTLVTTLDILCTFFHENFHMAMVIHFLVLQTGNILHVAYRIECTRAHGTYTSHIQMT